LYGAETDTHAGRDIKTQIIWIKVDDGDVVIGHANNYTR